METRQRLDLKPGSREEWVPELSSSFPYTCTRAEIHKYPGRSVPWHWHRMAEIFYIERGTLEYYVPGKHLAFPAGSGGFVNSNVLHMTRPGPGEGAVIQFLHMVDPDFIAGEPGSRIGQKYVLPLTASSADILAFYPGDPGQEGLLSQIRDAFSIEEGFGYEIRIREAMSRLWLELLRQAGEALRGTAGAKSRPGNRESDKLKQMMTYVYEHCGEKISVPELAAAAYLSSRECFRVFREELHTTPAAYIQSCRVEMACRMLARTSETVSAIGYACGFGSGSHFCKVFREAIGCTPLQYRRNWQDQDVNGR